MFKIVLLLSAITFSQESYITKNTISFRFGWSEGVFGHFGDRTDGFKGSISAGLIYSKDYDDLLSFGFIASQSGYFRNRRVEDVRLRFFSFSPVVFIKSDYLAKTQIYIGGGLYHWSSPQTQEYLSTSADEFGFVVGTLFSLNKKRLRIGLGFDLSHIIGVKGRYFDLGNINIINIWGALGYEF